jgi:ribosomal protein S18 acetylase RimI-like enzyme
VRRAVPGDVDALVTLHQEVQDLHVAARPDQFKVVDRAAVEGRIRELLAATETKVWVAELANDVVGYAAAILVRRPEHVLVHARKFCEIDQICVAQARRRNGVARALVQTIIDDARESGTQDIELSSWAFNQDAQRAFAALGFAPKSTRFELER